MDIVYDFSAPDPISNEMDYIVYSDLILPQDGYAVVFITKYSSFQDSVFAVSYSEKISGSGADLENDVNNWFIEDAKRGITVGISNIGVNSSWVDYLKERLAGTTAD